MFLAPTQELQVCIFAEESKDLLEREVPNQRDEGSAMAKKPEEARLDGACGMGMSNTRGRQFRQAYPATVSGGPC